MRNILVVEDSPLVLKILEHLFRHEPDLEPLFCASLGEARVLLETSADLLFAAIVDLNLPDAPDGEIVDLVMGFRLPCIVLTGSYDERRRDDLLLKGVVDYVLKDSQHSYEYAFRLLHHLERNASVKILVADDSEATLNLVRRVLTPHRYQIIEARDGEQALQLLEAQPDIDLLLVDHSMPGLSGFDLVKLLRQKLRRSELIILGLSADTKGSLSALFIKHGADDFLRKPFYPEELNCRVMSSLERRDLLRALKRAAQYDSLTELLNRRAFQEQGHDRLRQLKRNGQKVTIAMIDLDHFKAINDGYGHASGDSALAVFSRCLRQALPDALLGRLGGEEFAAITTGGEGALRDALEHLRESLRGVRYAGEAPALSFSAGVYEGEAEDLESLLHEADQRLYRAKRAGRARTE